MKTTVSTTTRRQRRHPKQLIKFPGIVQRLNKSTAKHPKALFKHTGRKNLFRYYSLCHSVRMGRELTQDQLAWLCEREPTYRKYEEYYSTKPFRWCYVIRGHDHNYYEFNVYTVVDNGKTTYKVYRYEDHESRTL